MKPAFKATPIFNQFSQILHKFEDGIPLLCDELNFLSRYEKALSSHGLDPVIKYYLKYLHDHPKQKLTFTLPPKVINENALHEIQSSIQTLLKNNLSHLDLKMSQDQFLKFKHVGYKELHFWSTKQLLAGVPFPFYGLPRFLYLQWGKLFGVVQLTFKNNLELDGDVLVYFEDIGARNLYQCIAEYTKNYENPLTHTHSHEAVLHSNFQFTPGKPKEAEDENK